MSDDTMPEYTEEYWVTARENARRLLDDAKVLIEHESGDSAIILGVLAIEELGKALIARWNVRNIASKKEYPTHIEKQAATFALLAADELLKDNSRRLKKLQRQPERDLKKVGPMCEQFCYARVGFYDDLRMVSTYADREPKWPTDVIEGKSVGLAREIAEFFRKAVQATNRKDSMRLASIIWQNDLGRL